MDALYKPGILHFSLIECLMMVKEGKATEELVVTLQLKVPISFSLAIGPDFPIL